ncbi:hypothetical protein NHF50_09050 [Flavobacterium sp. NRK F10]|nr:MULTISPECIES: hypothetical protein [Flavobacterium]MCO6175195.1 hypothetical protein [Flavobacterium sp. NRK F10]
MKRKLIALFAISGTILITSCSSGWSCKASYCKKDSTTKMKSEKAEA